MSETFDPSRASGAVRLADWGVIRASGADAANFLHSQLTQDVLHLEPRQARLAGFCSAKGRLQASFVVWREGPENRLLACSADLLAMVLKRLSMFVLRAKCKLSDASAEVALWGVAGAASDGLQAAEAPGALLPLTDALVDGQRCPRWLLAQPAESPAPALPVLDADTWRWLEVHSATPRIVAATVERFVPQTVNLELIGGVDFQKGCYPGQEVVARSQYRGTVKRRGFVVRSEAALQTGQEVFHSEDPGQPAGQVVLAASRSGAHAAFIELKVAAAQGGTLFAGAVGGPRLSLVPLPYPLPTDTVLEAGA